MNIRQQKDLNAAVKRLRTLVIAAALAQPLVAAAAAALTVLCMTR